MVKEYAISKVIEGGKGILKNNQSKRSNTMRERQK